MHAFLAGTAVALLLAVLTGVLYNAVGITAAEYFSTEYARVDDRIPEQLRGEQGQR